MEVFTIGFTQSTASDFFGRLRAAGIKRLLDVRLNNVSQLAGFAKRDDLAFFLRELCGAEYRHEPALAPTQELLEGYKKQRGSWEEYERRFLALLAERKVEETFQCETFSVPTALLCSEATAEQCHRRLVLEYLQRQGGEIVITHL